jgi:fermentation-respiration switch protein FrsA (DUF1100 family)
MRRVLNTLVRVLAALSALTVVPLAVAWFITRFMLHPKARVEDHALDDFSLEAEPVSFESRDGTPLAGWFIQAPASVRRPAPAVALSHGWARSRAELLPHADMLHRAGFAVLMFDYRFRGESGGTKVTMGVLEQDDLRGALDYLAGRPEVDPAAIGVFGMSLGGVIAVLVAATDPRVRALAVEAPFAEHGVIMTRSLRHYFRLPSFPVAYIARWILERRIGSPLAGTEPLRVIEAISPRPLLIIANELDTIIGHEETARLFEAAGEPKEFWLVRGAPHSRGWQTERAEYERRLVEFFRSALAAPHQPAEVVQDRA